MLLNRIAMPNYLQSGQRRRSHLTNAREHAKAPAVVKLDIRHFYPSITKDKVWRFFVERMSCSADVASLLARLCTHQGSAPIGSPVSQVLAFHVVRPLLDELHALALRSGLCFTCYVDDLTFSGDGANANFLAKASQVVRKHGFTPHAEACYGAADDKLVTGVLLTQEGLRVPATQLLKIEAARRQLSLEEDSESRVDLLTRLIGHLAAASCIDESFRQERWKYSLELRKLNERLPDRRTEARNLIIPALPRLRPVRLTYGAKGCAVSRPPA